MKRVKIFTWCFIAAICACGNTKSNNQDTAQASIEINKNVEEQGTVFFDITLEQALEKAKTDGKYVVVPKRKEAIRYCMLNAQDGDIIVLAGKGHEDYQEIKGVKYHMDERELIAEIIDEEGL